MTAHMEAAHYRQAIRLAWSERDFVDAVITLALQKGWRVHHDRPARTDMGWRTAIQGHKGFPDLVLARKGKVIIAELKSEKGRLTEDQKLWLIASGAVVWRPSDWDKITLTLDGYTVSDV